MRNPRISLPTTLGLGLGFGLVIGTAMLTESQGADEPRASLRVTTLAPADAKRSEKQLVRQASRLRRLVREQVRAQKEDTTAEPFARTREEAAHKLLAALIKENEGSFEPPQTSLSSIGLCDEALKDGEALRAHDAIKPHENLSRRLSIDWAINPDEEQGHRALEKALGRTRYLEVAHSCVAKQEIAIRRETESAFLLVNRDLGLKDSTARKTLELLAARDKELAGLDPAPIAALDANGKLSTSPLRSAQEIAALQQQLNAVESRYTADFKKLIGNEKWRQYQATVIGNPGTATDLNWAQYLLFREPAIAAPAQQNSAAAAPAKQIKLIPNRF